MSPTTPPCSMIMLTYRQSPYVAEAVRSLLAQEGEPIEIIISDDASPDDTFAVIEATVAGYAGPHSVILSRNARNMGVNAHILHTYEMSRGEIIIATSGDDLNRPDRARRTLDVFERERPLLAFSHAKVETLEGQPAPARYKSATFYHRRDARAAATSMQLYLGATCAWHKDMFRKYGPITEANAFEDLVYGFRAALENRISFIDDTLVTYRIGSGLTNSRRRPETPTDLKARRAIEVQRELAVLRQRLKDAETFGLVPKDSMMRRLSKALRQRRTRLAVISDQTSVLRAAAWRHPLETLAIIGSERRKWRRQARQD